MSNPDEENQLSQTSTEGQSSSNDGKDLPYQVTEGNGYRGLADLMSLMPRMGMFRRFGFLNALNLLFYQAELMKLEQAFIAQLESDEKSSNPCKRPFSKDWNAVSATDSQRTMIAEIRTLLEKYSMSTLDWCKVKIFNVYQMNKYSPRISS